MKLELRGHCQRYTVEQSLMALFPGEKPVYGVVRPETDESWAIVSWQEDEDGRRGQAAVELCHGGKDASFRLEAPLEGTPFQREGQRRHTIGSCFFQAYRMLTGQSPPWGMLTGVRPDKPAVWALKTGKTRSEVRKMLEERYFVSPERSALAVETAAISARAADELKPKDIAVYIGIPFCPTRCAYCSFVSQSVEKSFSLVEPYTDALIEEIRAGGKKVRETGLHVRALYMGGGTPTTLTASQMDRVLDAVHVAFGSALDPCVEITVEAGRPDTITAEKLQVLRRRGVGRISVNPQTLEDRVLQAIGRRHTAGDIVRAMELVEQAGFPHVNMDLIAGLPEDSPEGFRRSLDGCLSFGTDNITVHTLALKRGSRLLMEGSPLPPPEAVEEMLGYSASALRSANYSPYYLYRQKYMSGSFENIGWTRPGAPCLYNIYIMSELCSVLSFGAGGSTKMVEMGSNRIQRVFELKYPREYMERPEKWQENQSAFVAFYEGLEQARRDKTSSHRMGDGDDRHTAD